MPDNKPSPSATTNDTSTTKSQSHINTQQIMKSIAFGAVGMLVPMPAINALNKSSFVASEENLTATATAKRVLYNAKTGTFSPEKLGDGLGGTLTKECSRVVGKSVGIGVIQPELKKTSLSESAQAHAFAGMLAIYEMTLQPFDRWRAMRQSEKSKQTFREFWLNPNALKESMRGASANGLRQYGTWFIWARTSGPLNDLLKTHTPFNPSDPFGMFLTGTAAASLFSIAVYPIEAVKNKMQYSPYLTYPQAISNLYKDGGIGRFYKGICFKLPSNIILAGFANWVAKKSKEPDTSFEKTVTLFSNNISWFKKQISSETSLPTPNAQETNNNRLRK